jgi:oligosaccharide translocation protein RFT1
MESAAAGGARLLVALQVATRLLTFALNQLLVRAVGPEALGLATVRLELVLSTVLFLSREGFRLAALRQAIGDDAAARRTQVAKVVNLAWLAVPLGAVTSLAAVLLTHAGAAGATAAEALALASYPAAVKMYCLAAFIELLAEPGYVLASNQMRFALRASVEGSAVFARCVACLALALVLPPSMAALAFAGGQLIQAIVTCASYWIFLARAEGVAALFPRPLSRDANPPDKTTTRRLPARYLDPALLSLSLTFLRQSVVKHLLTEGDKLVLSATSSLYDQGVYALVTNYGARSGCV